MSSIKRVLQCLVLLIGWGELANANSHTGTDRVKIFVLRGESKSSLVLPAKDAKNQTTTFMRMPDLGGGNLASLESGHKGEGKGHAGVTGPSKNKPGELAETQIGSAKRPLQFSSSKISGTLRLPRVRFARVGVPMENRDEFPSLDFTQKSLKENGY